MFSTRTIFNLGKIDNLELKNLHLGTLSDYNREGKNEEEDRNAVFTVDNSIQGLNDFLNLAKGVEFGAKKSVLLEGHR